MKIVVTGIAQMITLIVVVTILGASVATSFILWDPQWFWASNTGWRTALVVLLLTTRFHKS